MTSDMAAAQIGGVRETGLNHLPCFAHRLRTCVEDAYNATKIENSKFRHLDRAAKKIVRKVKKTHKQNLCEPTLKSYVSTRLGSFL